VAAGIVVDWEWLTETIDGPAPEGATTEPQPETPRPQITTNLVRAIRPIIQPLPAIIAPRACSRPLREKQLSAAYAGVVGAARHIDEAPDLLLSPARTIAPSPTSGRFTSRARSARRAERQRQAPAGGVAALLGARFREFRRNQPLALCFRCGSKYMSAPAAG
jgi:hypothetical protein